MKIFISHSEKDGKAAQTLAKALAKLGFEVWRTGEMVLPGDNYADKIADALKSSDAMIVLISPDAMSSGWVRHEIQYALGSKSYSGRLVPILIRPTKDIPWILKRLQILRASAGRITSVAPQIVDHLKQSVKRSA